MTERGRRHVSRGRDEFVVGPSRLHWDGSSLVIDVDEWANPIPRPVRGRIRVHPGALFHFVRPLDDAGRHRWGPLAPSSRVEVEFDAPSLRWQGHAYLDSNEGDEPIETPFRTWDWSRSLLADGGTAVIYDVRQKNGQERLLAVRFRPDGRHEEFATPTRQALPGTWWGIERQIRCSAAPELVETLEDTPFYQRSVLQATICGERAVTLHESLDVDRLERTSTRLMLPWRMPRRG